MPTARRLPSGNYRCKVFSHTDSEGKNHYESFTAHTKQEAELMASQFKMQKKRRLRCDLTVLEAVDGYIKAKTNVLSPSTIRSYLQMRNTRFQEIGHIPIKRISNEQVQLWVSNLSTKISPKTVRNIYGLFSSSIGLYSPDTVFRITFPRRTLKRKIAPSDEVIGALYSIANHNMKKAIALAAFCSLRRGEISALKYSDIKVDTLEVNRDMVQGSNNQWVVKDFPKTNDSIRKVYLPKELIDLIGEGEPNDLVVPILPSTITTEFVRLRKIVGVDIRFHDLRHYFASIGAVLNIPQTYLEDFGGWSKGSSVMRGVYQKRIEDRERMYADRILSHASEVICSTK